MTLHHGGTMRAAARNPATRGTALAAALGRRIISGDIAPGASVPTEAVLCTKFGVSRTTVRDAMKRLHGKGLVAGGPRSGMHVQPTRQWNQLDADVLLWRLESGADLALLDDLYEIRTCFEPRACELAASRGSAADHECIRAHFDGIAATDGDTARHIEADLQFHLAIFGATGNIFFNSLGSAIRTALLLSFRVTQDRLLMPSFEVKLHGDVCAAITARDGAAAAMAMRALLAESRKTLGIALQG